jgi:hypothetical protein
VKSPFPGLDPYLEARWSGVHQRLITYAADQLAGQLPEDLRARMEERVFIESGGESLGQRVPDVHVAQYRIASSKAELHEGGDVAIAEPTVLLLEDDPITEGYIEIRERGGGKVITVIEVLSPANKRGGEGQKLYLEKQRQVLESDTNLVEIDLVRFGQHVIAFPEERIPAEHRHESLACIRSAWSRRGRELYVLSLRKRLPAIPIPLRQKDRRVALDLQALLDQCYENGRYDDIDYSRPPEPPLNADDASWAESILKAARKR